MSAYFYPGAPVYETDISRSGRQIKAETRQRERAEISVSSRVNATASVARPKFDYGFLYEFADEFGKAWSAIFGDLYGLRGVPDVRLFERIFLSEDRKLFVGSFLILVSVVYLFVFSC